MKEKILFLLTIFVVLVFAGSAYAQVSYFPQQFYGSVTVNGVPAPDFVIITAKHDGDNVEQGFTEGGKYGHSTPAFIVALHSSHEGDTIELYVQNVKAAEYPFTAGESTELNLDVTIANFCGDGKCESGESCSSCSRDCGSCSGGGGTSGGGGGGSGGGGGTTPPEEPEEEGPCVEDWICTDWAGCINSIQTRICADVNKCGTAVSKPLERQECEMPVICEAGERTCRGNFVSECSSSGTTWFDVEECNKGCLDGQCLGEGFFGGGLPTGMFIMLPAAAGLIVLIVIVMIGLYFMRIRK